MPERQARDAAAAQDAVETLRALSGRLRETRLEGLHYMVEVALMAAEDLVTEVIANDMGDGLKD